MEIPKGYKILAEGEQFTEDVLDYSTWRGHESWEIVSQVFLNEKYFKKNFHPSRIFIRKITENDFLNPIDKLMYKIGYDERE